MGVPALVVLADGTWFSGESFGAPTTQIGEVVFNTSMSGYQEILTDPSYRGQLVTMTAPHIGNYGVNTLDVESERVQVAGYIVREVSRVVSNYRATGTVVDYLQDAGVPGITGVDTRALTRRIRDAGAVMGAVAHDATPADVPEIVERIAASPSYGDIDFVSLVSTPERRRATLVPTDDRYRPNSVGFQADDGDWATPDAPLVVVLDYGVKHSILRYLLESGLRVLVVPHDTTAEQVRALGPDGILLSNGPGDPGAMDSAVAVVRELLGSVPIFGICLGHQLLSRAVGGQTFKLKFGHRGPNQPVMVEETRRVEITAQNHGYAVTLDSPNVPVTVTHRNLNDGTVEGIEVPSLRAFSAQHHPEAAPGPHDSAVLFDRFRDTVLTSASP